MITIQEYDRRWNVIIQAFNAGVLSRREASQAIEELHRARCRP